METSDLLAAHIHAAVDQPWAWGTADCTIWVADWCLVRWGVDPAAQYRGTYYTQSAAEKMLADGLVERVAPHLPWGRKLDPEPGDIGVIKICGSQVAAIWTGAHWAFRSLSGVGFTTRKAIVVWGE